MGGFSQNPQQSENISAKFNKSRICRKKRKKTDQIYKHSKQKEQEKAQEAQRKGEEQYKLFEPLFQETKEKLGKSLTQAQIENVAYQILILEFFVSLPHSQGVTFDEICKNNPIFDYVNKGNDLARNSQIRKSLEALERSSFIVHKEVRGSQTTYYLINDDEQYGYAKASKQVMKKYSQENLTSNQLRIETYKVLYYLYIKSTQIGSEREKRWREGYLQSKATQMKNMSITAVDKMDGHQFENYCAELLRKLGYSKVEVTKGSGDQGVDIIAEKGGVSYAIQCKRYSSVLGNTPVQEVHAGKEVYKCDVGVVLTNQYFTSGAKELAKATGVLLWDRDELQRMIERA